MRGSARETVRRSKGEIVREKEGKESGPGKEKENEKENEAGKGNETGRGNERGKGSGKGKGKGSGSGKGSGTETETERRNASVGGDMRRLLSVGMKTNVGPLATQEQNLPQSTKRTLALSLGGLGVPVVSIPRNVQH